MKLLLVINLADDWAEDYKDFTVDYDLRGTPIDDEKVNESIKYVEDAKPIPLPNKWHDTSFIAKGWNACLEEITGETE